jgi:chromosomal replication initiator protein
MTALPRIAQIQSAVAAHYGIPVARLSEAAPRDRWFVNTWDICHPRQEAMALAVLLTNHSYVRIGHFFGGRDHTTVLHACRAVEKRRQSDPKVHNAMRRITLELIR